MKPPPYLEAVGRGRPRGFLSRWLLTWRVLVTLPALFILLVAAFYAEEDWRGWHAWNKYRRAVEARGERLDLRAFIPPAVPDDQNFAAVPFIKSWFHQPAGERWADDYAQVANLVTAPTTDGAGRRQFVDLAAWASAFDPDAKLEVGREQGLPATDANRAARARAAAVVLAGLKSSAEPLTELRSASLRPHARYPVEYDLDNPWAILLPHLANVKKACQRLQLRACAELAAGQSGAALEDVNLMFRLVDSLDGEPFLISHLVRIASLQIELQPVWEGLAEQRWTEDQLQSLQAALQRYNFVADVKTALEAEQAAGVLTVDLVRTKGVAILMDIQDRGSVPPAAKVLATVVQAIVPRGWYYLEQLNYCRLHHLMTGTGIDAEQRRVTPQQVARGADEFAREVGRGESPARQVMAVLRHRYLSATLLPAVGRATARAAAAQTAVDEAALACAVERYRLARGRTPETLEALGPQLITRLPHDVITGEPLKYRRSEDGRPVIYSVGWDAEDDGGRPGKVPFDQSSGDWVWSYQAE